jgi:hypothetical protein
MEHVFDGGLLLNIAVHLVIECFQLIKHSRDQSVVENRSWAFTLLLVLLMMLGLDMLSSDRLDIVRVIEGGGVVIGDLKYFSHSTNPRCCRKERDLTRLVCEEAEDKPEDTLPSI